MAGFRPTDLIASSIYKEYWERACDRYRFY